MEKCRRPAPSRRPRNRSKASAHHVYAADRRGQGPHADPWTAKRRCERGVGHSDRRRDFLWRAEQHLREANKSTWPNIASVSEWVVPACPPALQCEIRSSSASPSILRTFLHLSRRFGRPILRFGTRGGPGLRSRLGRIWRTDAVKRSTRLFCGGHYVAVLGIIETATGPERRSRHIYPFCTNRPRVTAARRCPRQPVRSSIFVRRVKPAQERWRS